MPALEETYKKNTQIFLSRNWQMGAADLQWKKLTQALNNSKVVKGHC